MKKKLIIGIVLSVLALIFTIWFLAKDETKAGVDVFVKVKKGKFDVIVTTTGELQAENSEKIFGPQGLRKVRIYQVKIIDLVPEGTLVDSGDYVATLDRAEITEALKNIEEGIEELKIKYVNKQLDTTIQLSALRDQLMNKEFELEEKQIELEQSKYEPPATIRQKKIELQRSERSFEQSKENYKLKEKQARTQMEQEKIRIDLEEKKRTNVLETIDKFIIKAPSSGMVIYKTEWDKSKRKTGSQINTYDIEVATLPDFSSLVSITYINEIDFNKIAISQVVTVGVDAYPERLYTGEIISVANIGEQIKGSDAKVFEVHVKLNKIDDILRPSMTTSNSINTASYDSVLYIPLDALHTNDSLSYVYKRGKSLSKQIIITGEANDDEIIIEKGLSEEDEILISLPNEEKEIVFTGLELIPELKKRKEEEEKKIKPKDSQKNPDKKSRKR